MLAGVCLVFSLCYCFGSVQIESLDKSQIVATNLVWIVSILVLVGIYLKDVQGIKSNKAVEFEIYRLQVEDLNTKREVARITGSGCMLTSLIGAFCGAHENAYLAACSAMAAMGISGELAEEKRLRNGTGNATFRNDLIDAVFNLTEEQMKQGVHYEIYKR